MKQFHVHCPIRQIPFPWESPHIPNCTDTVKTDLLTEIQVFGRPIHPTTPSQEPQSCKTRKSLRCRTLLTNVYNRRVPSTWHVMERLLAVVRRSSGVNIHGGLHQQIGSFAIPQNRHLENIIFQALQNTQKDGTFSERWSYMVRKR